MKRFFFLDIVIMILIAVLIVTLCASYFASFFGRFVGISGSADIGKVIMIDAGHGGVDGGGVSSSGTIEKHINLAIAKKAKGFLESQGFTVIMVRETDEGLYREEGSIHDKKINDLKRRKDMIQDYKVDVFVSIHLNKFSEEKYYGAQVFYLKDHAQSKQLAELLQGELIRVLDRGNNRIEKPSADYYLFKGNTIPSVIVECGFLTNHEEEKLLQDEHYQTKLAWCIYSGLIKYFQAEQGAGQQRDFT